MKVRYPAVAGLFYPAEAGLLKKEIAQAEGNRGFPGDTGVDHIKIIGGIVPHAGYIYCAPEAVSFFKLLKNTDAEFDTFIILHPDHYGFGKGSYTEDSEAWETPLGYLEVDRTLGGEMNLTVMSGSGFKEHAAEVLLPFLQHYVPYEFKILPIGMHRQDEASARELAGLIHSSGTMLKRKIAVIASSDFSHYVTPEVGVEQDNLVLAHIEKLDAGGLYKTVVHHDISVCGYGPIMTLLLYARIVSESARVRILARGNSGKTGSRDLVVDYVSALVYS